MPPTTTASLQMDGQQARVQVQVGVESGPHLISVPTAGEWTVSTPDPHVGQIWIAQCGDNWLVSLDEALLLARINALNGRGTESIDWAAVGCRVSVGHSILVPTIVSGALALPPAVSARLGRDGLSGVRKSFRSDLVPTPNRALDLVELLRVTYSDALKGSEAAAFVSAGWDSRLEVGILRSVIGEKANLHLIHIFTSAAENQIVRQVAAAVGATLTILRPETFFHAGMEWLQLRTRLATRATWRPTIPMTAAVAAAFADGEPSVQLFGYGPYALKGRNYDLSVPRTAPRDGNMRARTPVDWPLASKQSVLECLQLQDQLWSAIAEMTAGWPKEAAWDYFAWAVRYGYNFGHRMQVLGGLVERTRWHDRAIVQAFMGLPRHEKEGTAFIRIALNELAPALMEIPVATSSGDGNAGTAVRSRDVHLTRAGVREPVMHRANNAPPHFFFRPPLPEGQPYAGEFRVLANQALRTSRCPEPRQVLEEGCILGGHRAMNALQIAEFLEYSLYDLRRH